MTILMPEPDQSVLARRDQIVAALRKIVPGEGVISSAAEMKPYESDGLMAYRQPPMVVVREGWWSRGVAERPREALRREDESKKR